MKESPSIYILLNICAVARYLTPAKLHDAAKKHEEVRYDCSCSTRACTVVYSQAEREAVCSQVIELLNEGSLAPVTERAARLDL